MVQVPGLCRTVMCILVPTVFYAKTAPLQNRPHQFLESKQHMSTDSPSPSSYAEIFLRQLSSINSIVMPPVNTVVVDVDDSEVVMQQRRPPFWFLGGVLKPPIKIYGDGTESRFPPFLEFLLQRVQSFFSVYKYEDTSRPAYVELNGTDNIELEDFSIGNKNPIIPPTKPAKEPPMNPDVEEVGIAADDGDIQADDDVFDDGIGVITIGSGLDQEVIAVKNTSQVK